MCPDLCDGVASLRVGVEHPAVGSQKNFAVKCSGVYNLTASDASQCCSRRGVVKSWNLPRVATKI